MITQIQLENLNLSELNILLSHLRMGEAHLRHQLNPDQLNDLLNLGLLTYEQLINVSTNSWEKAGNVALVLNTVITSIFGAWMGFSGFMELHLNSYKTLYLITAAALLTSIIVGFFSFRLTTKNAQSAVYNQRIHNIKLTALKLICTKEKESVRSLIKHLNHSLNYIVAKSISYDPHYQKNNFKKQKFNFVDNIDYTLWLAEINQAIKIKRKLISKEKIYEFYSEKLFHTLTKLNQIIESSYLITPSHTFSMKDSQYAKDSSFIQILSRPRVKKHLISNPKSWLRQNYLSLLAGIFPTLLGGFASMFVFLAGGPNLAKELGLLHIEQALRNPSARVIEFSIAICLTLYYGASFVYNNYKNFIRGQEVEKTKNSFIVLEKRDINLKRKMSILSQIKIETKKIINIYTAIENIEKYKIDNKNLLTSSSSSAFQS